MIGDYIPIDKMQSSFPLLPYSWSRWKYTKNAPLHLTNRFCILDCFLEFGSACFHIKAEILRAFRLYFG